jgi:hypothetical protein
LSVECLLKYPEPLYADLTLNIQPFVSQIRKYQVQHDDYFGSLEEYIKGLNEESRRTYDYVESKELCKDPMNQLIEKFKLSDKNIFALAPNFGHEEYWFYKNGCTLTFLDIDEAKIIEDYLKILPQSKHKESLTYFIGDAIQFSKDYGSVGKYDVFYVSGFTLDELRRGKIQTRNSSLYKKALNRITHTIIKKRFLATWPMNENPYMDSVVRLASDNLKQGGLFISQSYANGVDVKSNPHFVKLVKRQLSWVGITLLKLYCLRSVPEVTLTVGLKANNGQTLDFLQETEKNEEITSFHGRHSCSGLGCEVVYECSGK